MSSIGDVTFWLQQLKAGERRAAQPLWELYFRRLVAVVRERLRGFPRAGRDEQDLALSAFDSFFRAVEKNHFPRLDDRYDLWQVLTTIASRKVCDLVEYERREKRDHRRTHPLEGADVRALCSGEPDPAEAAELAEEVDRLLGMLPDQLMRDIAVRKLEGYTNEEIAGLVGWSVATVERRLPLIRQLWERDCPP